MDDSVWTVTIPEAASDAYYGPASKPGGFLCLLLGHLWDFHACRGDDGEPVAELCLRCRAERSVAGGGYCRCLVYPCRCAAYDDKVRNGWSEWMGS